MSLITTQAHIVEFKAQKGKGFAIVHAPSGSRASEKLIAYWGPSEIEQYGELLDCDAAGIAYDVEFVSFVEVTP